MIPDAGGKNMLIAYLAVELQRYVLPELREFTEDMALGAVDFLELEGLSEPYPSDLVALSVARLLAKGKRRPQAQEFLESHVGDETLLPIYTELLQSDPFNYPQWRLIAAGVLSRDTSNPTASRPSYTLHVERVPMQEDALDIGVYMTIKQLLDLFSGLWESRAGCFHLGIKGLPRKKGRNKELPSASEIVAYCRNWFERLADAKAWVERPEITVRDLNVL